MSGIGDDNILRLSYYKVDVGLIDDPDIMKIMRSASAENLALPEEALPFNQVSTLTSWLKSLFDCSSAHTAHPVIQTSSIDKQNFKITMCR